MTPIAAETIDRRYRIFAWGWALAVLGGMFSQGVATTPGRVVVTFFAAAVLMFPAEPLLLLGLSLAYMVHFNVDDYVMAFVHTGMIFLFSTGIALALLTTASRDRGQWRARFVTAFAPVGIGLAGVTFFAAGFAKLNTAFNDPQTSCASIFYAFQRTVFPYSLLPNAAWAQRFSIHFTECAELGGALSLMHWRTRRFGQVLSWTFLYLAGTNPENQLYEFTGPLLAMPLIGLTWDREPPALVSTLGRRLAALVPQRRTLIRVAVGLAFGALLLWAGWADHHHGAKELRRHIARGVFTVVALCIPPSVLLFGRARPLGTGGPGLARVAWLAVLVISGRECLPYLGLRVYRTLTMASNVVVNTRFSNHLLVREVPDLPFNHLAVLLRSSDPLLDSHGYMGMADWALFDYLARHPQVEASFWLDDERVEIEPYSKDPRVRRSFAANFLNVSPTVIKAGPVRCPGKTMPTVPGD